MALGNNYYGGGRWSLLLVNSTCRRIIIQTELHSRRESQFFL